MTETREGAVTAVAPPVPSGSDPRLEQWLSRLTGVLVVTACVVFVFVELHPRLLLRNTTPAGGDMGAHVWLPAFLRDHLLPWRVAGWTTDFYAGFAAGQFYFPLPSLLIVLLDVVLPYNVAFKLVTVSGAMLLPVGAYVFGRGLRAPRPAPEAFAVASIAFLFFKGGGDSVMEFDHHIMGGNIASTMAGEYSFTLALALSLLFLGTLVRALDGRGSPSLPALFLAMTVTSHLVVAIFATYAALVLWCTHRPVRTARTFLTVGIVGGLLTAAWSLPLVASLGTTTDMRYEPIGGTVGKYFDWMFLWNLQWYVLLLALVGVLAGAYYRRRSFLEVAAITVVAGGFFMGWETLRDLIHKAPAWNLRLLPFWYLGLYLLAALGAAQIVRWGASLVAWLSDWLAANDVPDELPADDSSTDDPSTDDPSWVGSRAVDEDTDPALRPPDLGERILRAPARAIAITVLALLLAATALARVDATKGFQTGWASYNYSGYEALAGYPEYRAFIDAVDGLPAGRLLWEGGNDIGAYGTPLALMLLPYWTHGRISSMEGVYFEASATTPYHFMTVATLAKSPSNPVRGITYRTIADFPLGVRYLQLLGVRYYAAYTPEAKAAADQQSALTPIATVPDLDGYEPKGWTIYRVADSATVAPLRYEPVVADDLAPAPNWKCNGQGPPAIPEQNPAEFSAWECLAIPWFNDPNALDHVVTDGGPKQWQRTSVKQARATTSAALPDVEVSRIRTTQTSIEFHVSRPGVPVLVKTSYYRNWKVEGAEGPWRSTPNFMVVVPTERDVRLEFATSGVEWIGRVGTILGIVGLAVLVVAPAVLTGAARRRRAPLGSPSRR